MSCYVVMLCYVILSSVVYSYLVLCCVALRYGM